MQRFDIGSKLPFQNQLMVPPESGKGPLTDPRGIGLPSGKKHEADVTPSPVPRVSRTLAETPNISGFLADTGPLTRVHVVCSEIERKSE